MLALRLPVLEVAVLPLLVVALVASMVAFQVPLATWQRWSPWLFVGGFVLLALVLILMTGFSRLGMTGFAQAPAHWHAMATTGLLMSLIFAVIYFRLFPRLTAAVEERAWPAAAVALEWEDETLHQTFHRAFVTSNPLSDYTLPLVSLVAGRKASRLIRREFGEGDIEDLPLPFYCVSADLARGRAQVHRAGPLWQALRASIAIPGVLPPVCLGGQVLVDGGVIDNLPVSSMRAINPGPVIGIDIAGEHALAADRDETDLPSVWQLLAQRWRGKPRRPGILRILLRAGMVNSASTAEQNAALSDLMLAPPVDHIDLMAWERFEDTIEVGYEHARERIADWRP